MEAIVTQALVHYQLWARVLTVVITCLLYILNWTLHRRTWLLFRSSGSCYIKYLFFVASNILLSFYEYHNFNLRFSWYQWQYSSQKGIGIVNLVFISKHSVHWIIVTFNVQRGARFKLFILHSNSTVIPYQCRILCLRLVIITIIGALRGKCENEASCSCMTVKIPL